MYEVESSENSDTNVHNISIDDGIKFRRKRYKRGLYKDYDKKYKDVLDRRTYKIWDKRHNETGAAASSHDDSSNSIIVSYNIPIVENHIQDFDINKNINAIVNTTVNAECITMNHNIDGEYIYRYFYV